MAKSLGVPQEITVDLGGSVLLKLTLIPPGKYMMGSPETETSDGPTARAPVGPTKFARSHKQPRHGQ
jgi:hypothetical protein